MSSANLQGFGQTTTMPTPGPRDVAGDTATLPETIPQTEQTVYRDSDTIIRIHPAEPGGEVLCVTLYVPLDEVTASMTPAHASSWREQSFETAPNTADALPESTYELYKQTVTELTERFGVSISEPTTGYGRCHRRHDGPGIVSFRTRLR
ncbi:hypothetical protein [Halonotius roseus]|uniref:Uncharacterized protein n=1 Tax=Halonotius roseus TaxID=2511997 RepID=A0A544QNZ7_9EURY|nr:hypothetical protein [Halonotius roseus]TQQ80648.1 hypothetical protein EWF95_09210 [Halonotius roseus]